MAKKAARKRAEPKRRRTAASEQIGVMSDLAPEAAAWLIRSHARRLRDRGDVPRTPTGGYNAQEIVTWNATQTSSAIQLPDDMAERAAVAADQLYLEIPHGIAWGVLQTLRDLQSRCGAAGLACVAMRILERLEEAEGWGDIPRPADPHDTNAVESEVREAIQEETDARRKSIVRSAHRALLHFYCQCDVCKKIRQGSKWIEKAPPEGWHHYSERCPDCTDVEL